MTRPHQGQGPERVLRFRKLADCGHPLATLYLQDTRGRSPLAAAAMLLPFSLAVIAGSALAAPALRRSRPQHVTATGLAAIAVAGLALIWAATSPWALPVCVAAAGAGTGLSSVAATGLGTDVDPRWRGTATGIVNTAAQLSTALGTAVLLLAAAATTGTPAPGVPVPAVAWALGAALALAASATFAVWGNQPPAHLEPAQPGRVCKPVWNP